MTSFRRSQLPKAPPRPSPSQVDIPIELDTEDPDGILETPLPPRPKKLALPPGLRRYALLEGWLKK